MDYTDEPLRDRERLSTPAVPTPNWNIETYEMEVALQDVQEKNSTINVTKKETETSTVIKQTTSSGDTNNMAQTPIPCTTSSSTLLTTPILSSQNRIPGEVTLTPTHSAFTPQTLNPHSSMSVLTPMVSGNNQAKNSIKVQ